MNKNPLFKPISPLYVWFWFVQFLVALCIVGYWIEIFSHHPVWLAERIPAAVVTTILFAIANFLIFRSRVVGVVGSVICWALCMMLMITTL
jgi:hypothetical protein